MELYFKYNARSVSELFDQCTADEWSNLIYLSDINLHKYLNVAHELFIKENLYLQRQDRWGWFVKNAENIPEQIDQLKELFFQQGISISNFSDCLYDILQEVNPKINTLRLVGTPNSGKSLIAQLIVAPFISAYVNNHNSENEFYLSSFLNKTICLCEELMCTPATAEDFKSILGGAKIDISKKYTSKQILMRTPIIVTTNHYKFGRGHLSPADELALQFRCYTFNFKSIFKPSCIITTAALSYLMLISCTR